MMRKGGKEDEKDENNEYNTQKRILKVKMNDLIPTPFIMKKTNCHLCPSLMGITTI